MSANTEADGIVWVGGLDDAILQAYQGTRAEQNLKGLPVVRKPLGVGSLARLLIAIPADWQAVIVLYEGTEWRDAPTLAAAQIDLAIQAYTGQRDAIFFGDPTVGPAGGFLLWPARFRLPHDAQGPRVGFFEPMLVRYTAPTFSPTVH